MMNLKFIVGLFFVSVIGRADFCPYSLLNALGQLQHLLLQGEHQSLRLSIEILTLWVDLYLHIPRQ